VAIVDPAILNQHRIRGVVERIAKALSSEVVGIRYDLADDWMGNVSFFFRIILTDKASNPENLRDVSRRVTNRIRTETKLEQAGLQTYFSFRSQSEQAKLKDPDWA
jgi:hypothetical protein